MKVKIKKLVKGAVLPTYSRVGDAGADLVAIDCCFNHDYDYIEFGTGLAVEIPENHVGLVFPRSSISKTPHSLRNSVALLDSNFRGEIKLRFSTKEDREHLEYMVGDRIGQLVILPYPKIEFEEAEELSKTNRGEDGFGSSGR